MKQFVTLFTPAENVHLVKDVGQIPYQLQQQFNYKSTLVCYQNSDRYPFLEDEVKGLNINFIKDKGKTFFWDNAVITYLLKNSKSIDVLNLYHLTQASMLYGMIYKYKNPNGILYLKMDMDVNKYRREGIRFSENSFKDLIHQKLLKQFKKKVDIISVETANALQVLKELDKSLFDKAIKISSGLDFDHVRAYLPDDLFSKKENIILTVGRIGIEAKNNEFLLNTLGKMNLKDWKVFFVGPINPTFKPVIDTFFQRYPNKKEQVIFTGPITDRKVLWQYYAKAKLFCLTSRWESFAIVLCEAQFAGNYIIGTNTISSIKELTQKEKLGDIIALDNEDQLTAALKKCMKENFYNKSLMEDIIFQADKYDWSLILNQLDERINKAIASKSKV